MHRHIATCLLLIIAAAQLSGADTKPSRDQALDLARRWVDGQRTYEQIPGLSLAIVNDQSVLWSGGFGLADPAAKTPATADTLYSICSVSKLFTSIGVMQLRDEGKLDLDDPVARHLPWFKLQPAEGGGEVTVRGILTHSAGLPRESEFPYWTGEFEFPTREQIRERLSSQKALYAPETYFQYSNLGLTLAGEIITAVAGKPFDVQVRQRILEPLGLRNTFPEMPEAEKGKRLALGHSALRRDGTRRALPFFTTRGVAPAAGFASTASDLARFIAWQFRVLSGSGDNVLATRTLREMQRAQWADPDLELFRGLGFGVRKTGDKVFVGHGGSCPGFRTEVFIRADTKLGVAIMANASGVDLMNYVKVIDEIVGPNLKNEGAKDPSLDVYAGSYDEFPWDGETIFVPWGTDLAAISLPSRDPMRGIEKFRRSGEHEFRRVRKDGSLGETIRFVMGPDGRATNVWHHSNPTPRMR